MSKILKIPKYIFKNPKKSSFFSAVSIGLGYYINEKTKWKNYKRDSLLQLRKFSLQTQDPKTPCFKILVLLNKSVLDGKSRYIYAEEFESLLKISGNMVDIEYYKEKSELNNLLHKYKGFVDLFAVIDDDDGIIETKKTLDQIVPKNSRTPPILPVPVGKFNEINQCSLPTKSEQGLEEFCYSVNDLKKKTFKITFNRLLDPKIVNLKLLKLLDSKKSEILNAVYSIEVGKVADKRYQILSTKKIPTFLKKYYFTYLNPFMSKYFKQPDVDSILIKYKPTCTHKTKDVYTFSIWNIFMDKLKLNQCHECIKTPCIEDFAHDIKIQPKIMVNSEDSIMLIFKNSKSSKNQIVECQQIQLTCENQQYVYANNELIENKEFFVTTNGENLCLAV